MKIKTIVILVLGIFFSGNVFANVGVFTGYGHSIKLSSTGNIQMLSEDVRIVPGRGRLLFDGGVAGFDRVDYDCIFVLKNLKKENVSIQVGFPLNAESHSSRSVDEKTSDLVSQYGFISQTEGHQYTVRYVRKDKDGRFGNLFLWEMKFKPDEIKTIRVSYSMPISMTLASTAPIGKEFVYGKEWYENLENCFLEYFGYVTETGKSWSGPIVKATFQVYVEGFERYLNQRPLFEEMNARDESQIRHFIPVASTTFFRTIQPQGWKKSENGYLKLSFENYEADKDLQFFYYILTFPRTVEDLERLMSELSPDGFSEEDCEDLKDIFREYNGEKTANRRIKNFVDHQIWYGKEIQQPIPETVINAIGKKRE